MIPDESTFVFWMTKNIILPFSFFFFFFFVRRPPVVVVVFSRDEKAVQIRSAKKEDLEKDDYDKMSSTNERTNERTLNEQNL
jgi:hypothetical protein